MTKRYPGVVALDEVTVELRGGEVLGVVGENGAGKSTLLDVLSGVVAPDSGAVELAGSRARFPSHRAANVHGVFRVFQERSLIGELRVYENLLLGHEQRVRRTGPWLPRRAMKRRAAALLDELGVNVKVTEWVRDLDVAQRQALEIARALLLGSLLGIERPIVLFDEPTASLDRRQVDTFMAWVSALRGRASVVLVSHFLPEVLAIADRVAVLKDGRVVSQTAAAQLDEPTLHALMVGRERAADHHREDRQQPADTATLMQVRDLSVPGRLHGISLDVRAGEIVGVGGLVGSGRSELARAVAGAIPTSSGTVTIGAAAPTRPKLRSLIDAGLAFVPAERGVEGLVLDASLLANFQLPSLRDRFTRWGWWLRPTAAQATQRWIKSLGITAATPVRRAGTLSGGGQQKVVLAKWLERQPRVLVLDSPTRGVDTGAREAIYTLLRERSSAGTATLLATDDLAELIGLSHRIAVLVHGRLVAIVDAQPGAKPSEQEIVMLMSSGAAGRANEEAA